MNKKTCILIGAPVQDGAGRLGCDMGPSAYRAAGLGSALENLGYTVRDTGNLTPEIILGEPHPNTVVRRVPEVAGWTATLSKAVRAAHSEGIPIVLGGDHSLAAGTLSGHAQHAADIGRKLFVLWLDAHPDLHTLETTNSGNLHGVPMAYALGLPGFEPYFPPLATALNPQRICMMGLRSVDPAERKLLVNNGIRVHDMRAIDENGVAALLGKFLEEVQNEKGCLHVSLDVDFLDPEIAPGVGTTVPGGATFREAHLIMEILHDCNQVTSLDLVELNPFLDDRGRTARLMVDLTASLMGRSVLDRPTRSF